MSERAPRERLFYYALVPAILIAVFAGQRRRGAHGSGGACVRSASAGSDGGARDAHGAGHPRARHGPPEHEVAAFASRFPGREDDVFRRIL
jgi:hypothetical protein